MTQEDSPAYPADARKEDTSRTLHLRVSELPARPSPGVLSLFTCLLQQTWGRWRKSPTTLVALPYR